MVIELPWYNPGLHPNARHHRMAKAALTKQFRNDCHWLTEASAKEVLPDGEIAVSVTFYPPDKRKRDLDGMFSAIKSGLDGMADALAVNDYRFNPVTLVRADPVKGGKVVVTI